MIVGRESERNRWTLRWAFLVLAVAGLLVSTSRAAGPPCPSNENRKLLPDDQDPENPDSDHFGFVVAISGDVAIVGAILDSNNGFADSGSAYVYRFDGVNWIQEQKLTAFDESQHDHYGYSVSIEGDVAVVGSRDDDPSGGQSGSAYVYRHDGATWALDQKLTATEGSTKDEFGCALDLSGDLIVVGADQRVEDGPGLAYAYRHNGAKWVQEHQFLNPEPSVQAMFGYSIAASGDVVVVGAMHDDELGEQAGAAWVFRRVKGVWVQEAKLTASDGAAAEEFGYDVDVFGETIVVGAWASDDLAIPSTTPGSAYVFRYDGAAWNEEQKLTASDGAPGDEFGVSVAVSGDLIIVGMPGEDDPVPNAGASYLFRHDGVSWVEEAKLTASDRGECCEFCCLGDEFGYPVAIDGERAIVGADRNDDAGSNSGAAYIFVGLGDCNVNGELDLCDIALGASNDVNGNGVPDDCEPGCIGDLDGSGAVDFADILLVVAGWGCGGCAADVNGSGAADFADILALISVWGPC
ncbi:MAG: hypothetical protein GY715_03370 [Planctomycetes bacterium]|nr:hypothetical protein [Planctomycetota bacterium]